MTTTIPFWTNDPTILFKSEYIYELYPKSYMTFEQKLNSITKLILLLTFLGYLISHCTKIVITGIITIGIIVLLYNIKHSNVKNTNIIKEGFDNNKFCSSSTNNFTPPTPNNPLMNVLLTDIADNPNRVGAAPAYNELIEKEIDNSTKKMISNELNDNNIDKRLFKDLGDGFEFDRSQRNFYATANTQIPNDQKAFADFCYGSMPSCKEGDSNACSKNNPRYNLY
jgi:hypothetical protein